MKTKNSSVSFFKSFRFKLALLVVSVQLLLIFISGFYLINQTRNQAAQNSYLINSENGRVIAEIISGSFEEFSNTLTLMAASSADLSSFDRDRASSFLKSYKISQLFLSGEVATLFGPDRKAIANSSMTSEVDSNGLYRDFSLVSAVRPYYGELTFNSSYYERIIAVQVENMARKNGVLISNFSLKRFYNLVKKTKIGNNGYIFITDHNGRILVHPDNKLVATQQEINDIGIFDERLVADQHNSLSFVLKDNKEYLVNKEVLKTLDVIVWVVQPKEEIDVLAASLRLDAAWILFILLLVSVLLAIWLSNWLTQPLNHLAEVMNRAGKNGVSNLEEETNISRNDEIGVLAKEFDVMKSSLKRYISKLDESKAVLEKKVKQRTAELEKMSRTDPLTGAPNRRDMLDKINMEAIRSKRTIKDFCVIIGDIDNFKQFNDTHGHECGDEVLKLVVNEIKSSLRQYDFFCRWGGEEFLMVLPETNIESAVIVAERVRNRIERSVLDFQGKLLKITMTLGVSVFNIEKGEDESIAVADEALYYGKTNGRNCVVIVDAPQKLKENINSDNIIFKEK